MGGGGMARPIQTVDVQDLASSAPAAVPFSSARIRFGVTWDLEHIYVF